MSKDFSPPRPASRPTVYAYEDSNPQYAGLLKVGYTTVGAQSRIAQRIRAKNSPASQEKKLPQRQKNVHVQYCSVS